MSLTPVLRSSGGAEVAKAICVKSTSGCLLQATPDCEAENCSGQFTIIIFPFLALLFGILATPLSRSLKVPYTLFLLIIGIIIGVLGCAIDLGLLSTSLRQWVHLNPPTTFFYVFLAPLIFEASFNTRWHVFKRLLIPILLAAFVIVILQVGLIAAFQKLVIRTGEWTWWAALMFGSMLSATDPISVTATLKSLGASEFLNTLIEGESLVNDGSAFVLWEAFFENTVEENSLSTGDIIASIFRLSLGGMLMGVAFGIVALVVLGLVYDEFEVETSLTVIVAFLGFWTAQAPSKLSGVICNVASGLVISAFGRQLITPAVRGPLTEFWELLSWIANTIVFVHAGVLLTAFIWSCSGAPNTWRDYVYIIVYYLYLQAIRILLILVFRPLMAYRNQWFQWREALVVGFSGLRGAVSLILALEVAGNSKIPDAVTSRVVLWTTGIVALSLLVNGFFVKPLISKLGLDKTKKSREDFLNRARAIMVQRTLMILDTLCIETTFKSARWSYVVKNVLPEEWLEHGDHAEGYRDGLEQLYNVKTSGARKSLEIVKNDHLERVRHSELQKRFSRDAQLLSPRAVDPSPRRSDFLADLSKYSPAPESEHFSTPKIAAAVRNSGDLPSPTPLSLRPQMSPMAINTSREWEAGWSEGGNRRSIDVDVGRYGSQKPPPRSERVIHREVASLHKSMEAGEEIELSEKDREVRRRLLTAILSHTRALSNAGLVEVGVLHKLEEDCQLAIDANEEGRSYDLFSFLDMGRQDWGSLVHRKYLRVIEGKRLQGQTSITTAIIVFSIMTEILKEEILHDSAIVQLQAERLYEASAALLNRLEALNLYAFEWVESQFAVYVCSRKQDDVLEDLLASGIVDDQEFKMLHEELIDVRRKHVQSRQSILHQRRSRLPPHAKPRQLLAKHPLFRDLSADLKQSTVDRYGELVHLKGGQRLQAQKGSLVLVLEGMLRPLDDFILPSHFASQVRRTNQQLERAVVTGEDSSPLVSSEPLNSNENAAALRKQKTRGFTPLASGAQMHWCFPTNNSFCGPSITLAAHGVSNRVPCAIAEERTVETQFGCCEISGKATAFTLPVPQVRKLARESAGFRVEITRSLAREIVLESVADQRPYALSHVMDSITGGLDVNTVVGRAVRVLERLPYMVVVALLPGERARGHLQGPGVLLNGTVRVSIVDTSGLIGAINLLHEELTGPALLPAGGLILEEVHKQVEGTSDQAEFAGSSACGPENTALQSKQAKEAAAAVCELYGALENDTEPNQERQADVLAHILIEEVTDPDHTAILRLQRWQAKGERVDLNGRFGMIRHVELAPFTGTEVHP